MLCCAYQSNHCLQTNPCVPARVCVLQEVLIALVRLYQRFTFKLQPGQVPLPLKQTFALIPAQGLRVRVHKRS
jgi:hypothetical protein